MPKRHKNLSKRDGVVAKKPEILHFEMTPFLENGYVLRSAGECLIVDPGEPSQDLERALAGHRVVAIVNTHGHCDHCGGNAYFKERTGAPLLCHRDELPLLRSLPQQGLFFGVPVPASPDPDGFLQQGDVLTVGDVTLEVREAPGHSPGHIVLVGNGFVFGGDVLFLGSIGRTDLPGGSYEQLLHSIKTQLLTLPDDVIVYPGHGPVTTVGRERRTNPFLVGL